MGRNSVFHDRDAEIAERFKNGENQIELAKVFNLTRQRVSQILGRFGLSREDGGQTLQLARKREQQAIDDKRAREQRLQKRGLPTGVSFDQRTGRFRSYVSGKSLGYSDSAEEALQIREKYLKSQVSLENSDSLA